MIILDTKGLGAHLRYSHTRLVMASENECVQDER